MEGRDAPERPGRGVAHRDGPRAMTPWKEESREELNENLVEEDSVLFTHWAFDSSCSNSLSLLSLYRQGDCSARALVLQTSHERRQGLRHHRGQALRGGALHDRPRAHGE